MTEQEWLASDDPAAMVNYLLRRNSVSGTIAGEKMGFRTSERKLRLYAVACWRHLWPKDAAEAAAVEEWVEGKGERPEVPQHWVNQPCDGSAARDAAQGMWPNDARRGAALLRCIVGNPFRPLASPKPPPATAGAAMWPMVLDLARDAYEVRVGRRCDRCPKWEGVRTDEEGYYRTDAMQAIIDHGKKRKACVCGGTGSIEDGSLDPARLAVLADSLEDAGVTDERLITHLRSPGPHVRGCWALDLVLGKE